MPNDGTGRRADRTLAWAVAGFMLALLVACVCYRLWGSHPPGDARRTVDGERRPILERVRAADAGERP